MGSKGLSLLGALGMFVLASAWLFSSCGESRPDAFPFSIGSHMNGDSISRIDCNNGDPTYISGQYEKSKIEDDTKVYTLVKAPDDLYYVNKQVDLGSDGEWVAKVYIGSKINHQGEPFTVFFVAAGEKLAERLRKIEEIDVNKYVEQIPQDGRILSEVRLFIKVPCDN